MQNNMLMQQSILRTFKSYLGEPSSKINKEALKHGILLIGEADDDICEEAISLYGVSGDEWNQTFHKSFAKLINTSTEELFIEQMVHYFTTYGFEALDIYSKDKVYVPKEELDVPELDIDKVELVVIKAISEKELSDRIMNLATSGIALSGITVSDILYLKNFVDKNRIEEIKNRELKAGLFAKLDIVPSDPEEFLRYMIYSLTGETLKIKNERLFSALKYGTSRVKMHNLLSLYLKDEEAYNKLASIFYRNKMLFLALKIPVKSESPASKEKARDINRIVNKIRKLADENHKPLKRALLDTLTLDIEIENEETRIISALDKVTIFREIRILDGVAYRIYGADDIVYRIRNGSSYATKLKPKSAEYVKRLQRRYDIIKEHLIARVAKNIKGKTVYIPDNVSYTVPSSEKQFNGNYPNGTYIQVPRESDMIYGIHWTNLCSNVTKKEVSEISGELEEITEFVAEQRVDLDIKTMNKNEVFGWDAVYKSGDDNILFSGDMTDAPLPNGATELFFVGKNYGNSAFLITVNDYTEKNEDIPFEFVIAKADGNKIREDFNDYILDPNDIIEKVNLKVPFGFAQVLVGTITIGDTIRLYLSDMGQGNQISSRQDENTMISLNYLQSFNRIKIRLKDLLESAGAIFKDSSEDVDYDLSINTITKDTIISMLSENNI